MVFAGAIVTGRCLKSSHAGASSFYPHQILKQNFENFAPFGSDRVNLNGRWELMLEKCLAGL